MSVSFISALEPLLGGGLALNLAYLYLQWFYYLEQIGKTAVEARGKGADSNLILEKNKGHKNVKCVDYLMSLGLSGRSSTADRKATKKPFCLPIKKWFSYPLAVFFITKLDRYIAVLGTGVIMCLFVIGVGHGTGIYETVLVTPSDKTKKLLFCIVVTAFLWPVAMAVLAFLIRNSVAKFVKMTVGESAISSKAGADKALDNAPKN